MLLRIKSNARVLDSETDPERAAELARVAAYPQGPTRKLKADENDIFNGEFMTEMIFQYQSEIRM